MATKQQEFDMAVLLIRRATGVSREIAEQWAKVYDDLYKVIDLKDTQSANIARIRKVYKDIDLQDEFAESMTKVSSAVIAGQVAAYGFKSITPTKYMVRKSFDNVMPTVNMSTKEMIARAKGASYTSTVNYTLQAYQQGWTRTQLKKALTKGETQSVQHTNTVARTSVNAVSNESKKRLYDENRDMVDRVLFSATLDSRTTDICMNLDGTVYLLDDAPVMPLHPNERSQLVPILIGEDAEQVKKELLPRPSVVPKGQEQYEKQGLKTRTGKTRKPSKTDRSPLKGQASNAPDYETWLRGQPKYYQEDIIGKKATERFRNGASLKEVTGNSPITQGYLDKAITKTPTPPIPKDPKLSWATTASKADAPIRKELLANPDFVVVNANIQKLMDGLDDDYKINLQTGEGAIKGRVDKAKEFWQDGGSMDLSISGYNKYTDVFEIDDGRHRLVAAYELGARTAPIIIDKKDVAKFVESGIIRKRPVVKAEKPKPDFLKGNSAGDEWHQEANWTPTMYGIIDRYDRDFQKVIRTDDGAYYQDYGEYINMTNGMMPTNRNDAGVWRHEYGHFLDYQVGQDPAYNYSKNRGRGAEALSYSDTKEFQSAMDKDVKRQLSAHGHTNDNPSLFDPEYEMQEKAVQAATKLNLEMNKASADGRKKIIADKAKKVGLTKKDIDKFFDEDVDVSNYAYSRQEEITDVTKAQLLDSIARNDLYNFMFTLSGGNARIYSRDFLALDTRTIFNEYDAYYNLTYKKGLVGKFSDMVGSANKNKIGGHDDNTGIGGHSTGYYSNKQWQGTEVIANYFALRDMGAMLDKMLFSFMPETTKLLDKAMRNVK